MTTPPDAVLIVDDDEDFAESLAEIIETQGYSAQWACSAAAAEKILELSDADAVLIDVRLGSADGMDLIGRYRERWPNKLFVAMTAYASMESALHALKTGAYDYLRKPFHPDELFASLNRVFGRLHLECDRRSAQSRLAQSEQRFRELTEGSVQGVYIHRDWQPLYVNAAFTRILGYAGADELLALPSLEEHVMPSARERVNQVTGECLEQARPMERFDYEGRRKDGTPISLQGFVRTVVWDDGPAVQCAVVDVTEEKRALRRLHLHEQIISSTADLMAFVGLDAHIEAVNDAWASAFGRPPEDCVGLPLRTLGAEMHEGTQFDDAFLACAKGEHAHVKAWFDFADVGKRFMDVAMYPYRGERDSENGVVMAWRDLTETRDLSEKLSFQASHDVLTGVWNRRAFEDQLAALVEEAGTGTVEHALCYLDLDQFKLVNDTCGHLAGDELLRQLGAMLPRIVRKDDLFARLGGDEFAVLMHSCPLPQAMRAAESLLNAIREYRFNWEGNTFALSASVGLVPLDAHSESVSAVMSRADRACYAAKDGGRDRLHVFRSDDKQLARRHGEMHWATRVGRALEESRFELWAQQISPIEANAPEAAPHYEILLRMRDESGGIVPPGAFLPAAERFNLITRIDAWVVDRAVAWITSDDAWLAPGERLFINLSGQSLVDEELLERIVDRILNTGLPEGSVGFEITETAAIANLSQAERFIGRLRECGCSFALDDFGSGLSSFGYLKSLPVDYLKIDGLFVKDILSDPIDLAMVRSINEIGHIMGKKTVAEFVENADVLSKLQEIGIDYAQGYHIGYPEPLGKERLAHSA